MVDLEGRNQEDSLRLLLPTQHVVRPTLLFKNFLTVINRQPWGMQPPIVGKIKDPKYISLKKILNKRDPYILAPLLRMIKDF